MRYPLLLMSLFMCGCIREVTTLSSPSIFQSSKQSVVAIAPMEDCTLNRQAGQTVAFLTESLKKRIEQKGQVSLTSVKSSHKQFLVTLQLLQYGANFSNTSEFNMNVLLKILDTRAEKPQEIYQEMINYTTLLNGSVPKEEELDRNTAAFRVGPIGLAHAKMTREVASKIEDYTQTTSRIGNMPRRRPEFKPGKAGAEGAQLE